jgi:FdhE protein
MTEPRTPNRFDPIEIGAEAKPPFAVVPLPATLFRDRAERYATLAAGHQLEPYLQFLAGLSRVQHEVQTGLAEPELPDAVDLERAASFGMPPITPGRLDPGEAVEALLDRFFDLAGAVVMPALAAEGLQNLRTASRERRREMVFSVLAPDLKADQMAEAVFTAAALQVQFARMASRLDAERLAGVADGACPACGSAPVTSSVVGWPSAHGSRFCTCWLCATRWSVVRVKCVLCSSTKGIAYQEIEGVSDTIRAETCDECRGYVKILAEVRDPSLDPVADDVASLGLDMLVRQAGWTRGSFNPYMMGS